MSIKETAYLYCDVIIITLQINKTNPKTEIALECEYLASHFSFVAINAVQSQTSVLVATRKTQFATVKSALREANEK